MCRGLAKQHVVATCVPSLMVLSKAGVSENASSRIKGMGRCEQLRMNGNKANVVLYLSRGQSMFIRQWYSNVETASFFLFIELGISVSIVLHLKHLLQV